MNCRRVIGALVMVTAVACASASSSSTGSGAPADPLDEIAADAWSRASAQLNRTATELDPANGIPRATDRDGRWEQRPVNQWTSGFFAGTLWYMYQSSRKSTWRQLAERWTRPLESNKDLKSTHDLGFMIFNSFGHAHLLTNDAYYRRVAMDASRSLASRFNSNVHAIQSWDTFGGSDARGTWQFPVIIDNMMNLELLFWAAANDGDTSYARMAHEHALTTARAHVRPDGSTSHVILFDPATGALLRAVTWQGYSDSSTWARGQAWAIHGFTTAFGRTRDSVLLNTAQRTADWFISHLPPDAVPYWDFSHPKIPDTERDASAAAIASSALYDLARYSDATRGATYRRAADRMIRALATNYMAKGSSAGAILAHATGGRPQNSEVDVGLVYADYYFVEALLRRQGKFLE